jgi:hypothetical protein
MSKVGKIVCDTALLQTNTIIRKAVGEIDIVQVMADLLSLTYYHILGNWLWRLWVE